MRLAEVEWIGVKAFEAYGLRDLAQVIASLWLLLVDRVFQQMGQLHEKYDMVAMEPGGGAEYVPQAGFGWTNGVTTAVIDQYRPGL